MDPEVIKLVITIVAALISVIAAILAWVAAKRSRVLQTLMFLQKYYGDLRIWGDQVVDSMTEALELCRLDPTRTAEPSFFNRKHNLCIRLSALADRGRWFFPNIHGENFGRHKKAAFRGFRQSILDSIVYAYQAVQKLNCDNAAPNASCYDKILEFKQDFVTQIQDILDPRKREEEMKHIRRDI
jgi:hypothetical protein